MTDQTPAAEAFPLYWPEGWPRTEPGRRRRANFRLGKGAFARVRDQAIHEVKLMGGRHIVLSTNIPLRLDGLPHANAREPDDPGVAMYWYDRNAKQQRCIACDRWDLVVHNLRAIEKSIEALRGLARWGSTEIVNRAFQGFAELPASGDDWRAVLGVPYGERPPLEAVKDQYRKLARAAHPDHGGSPHEMQRLNAAMEAAEKELD